MTTRSALRVWGLLILSILVAGGGLPARAVGDPAPAPAPLDILPLDQVRIGMHGYGLTVFSGVRIEPFAVEVVSVMRDFAPHKGVIWVRCPDQRLQKTGPVAGMSGSPIYLWPDGQEHPIGSGGKLIGAFAFGFSLSKDCFAGVQAIESMIEVGNQLPVHQTRATAPASAGAAPPPYQALRQLMALLGPGDPAAAQAWRARLLARLFIPSGGSDLLPAPALPAGPQGMAGRPQMLMLPMVFPSAHDVTWLAPLLAPAGILPLSAPDGIAAGMAPKEWDMDKVKLAPGSVLSIPLAFGDLDLSAQGTVTAVLPGGGILAFGHPMFGEGPTALPMANGFVHCIIPSIATSFKLGGSGIIKGTILRDDSSAIAGRPGPPQFQTAPTTVTVEMPNFPKRTYHYQLVNHKTLTPILGSIVALESLTADCGMSPGAMGAAEGQAANHTLTITADLRFSDHHRLLVHEVIPGASDQSVVATIVPPLAVMIQNPYQSVTLESMTVNLKVDPVNRGATILEAHPQTLEIAPGKTLAIAVRLQPFGKSPFTTTMYLAIPSDLPDGDYPVTVCDARAYALQTLAARPYLQSITSVADLTASLDEVLAIPDDQLFAIMPLPRPGLAIGRTEMPDLPSSRRALIASGAGAPTVPCTQLAQTQLAPGLVPTGQVAFTITVKKDLPGR